MIEPLPAIGRAQSQRDYWLCQFIGWGAYGLVQIYAGIVSLDVTWERLVVEVLILHTAAFGLTHWLRGYVRRSRWITLRILPLTGRILIAGIILSIPMGIASSFMAVGAMHDSLSDLAKYTQSGWTRPATLLRVILQVVNWAAVFTCWLVIYLLAVRTRAERLAELRRSELARALQFAELRRLTSQLNPHFLFNA